MTSHKRPPAVDISRGAKRQVVGVGKDTKHGDDADDSDDTVPAVTTNTIPAGLGTNGWVGHGHLVGGGRPSVPTIECKDYVKSSPPKYVLLDTQVVNTRWTSYHNYIGNYWCFVVDPEKGSTLALMVSERGCSLDAGMRWVGTVLTNAFTRDSWPPSPMHESEFPCVLPVRTTTGMKALVHLDVDKMMSCQVRATSKEMNDYKKKLFDCTSNTTPDYHLLRPFFHNLLENITEMTKRTDLIREFMDCWPNNVIYSTILYTIILYPTVLYDTLPYYTILYFTIFYYTLLYERESNFSSTYVT